MNLNTLKSVLSDVKPEIWLALGVVFVIYVLSKLLSRKKLPPGPIGLPIVGYLPFLTKDPHLKFIELAEKYGNVFSLRLGSHLLVVLNDSESIREAFAKQELLARPPNSFSVFQIETPFFTPNYNMWKEQRRFVVQTMKDLGLGKSKIEGHIQEEIHYFLNFLEHYKGKPMNLLTPLTPSMSNNICALVFGERYEYDNPDRKILDNSLELVSDRIGSTNIYMVFPWMKYLPFSSKILKYDEAIEAFQNVIKIIQRKVREHSATLDSNNIRDFIDGYLLEMKNKSEKDVETTFTDQTLLGCAQNLFGAGSETVRTSISWSLYIMSAYPEIQSKVHKEIDNVLGSSRFPEFSDQKDMLYTQAVIREVMRWKTVVPINVLRYALEDIEVSGKQIPKGSFVTANFWAVHHNPKYWKDPENFRPERFLNKDGTLLKTNHFMPFSVGKRSCPGETMAMMELFLYFVAILQKFRVSFPEGYKPDFKGALGITYCLKKFEICITPR